MTATPLLRVRALTKQFPGLTALDAVDLDVHPGEIVALVGHNGSGKSTLIKILSGVYTADGGEAVTAEGAQLHFIHQDLALVEELSAAENIALSRADAPLGPFRDRVQAARARELVSRFGPVFDVTCPLKLLSPAQRAVVAISRAMDGWSHPGNVLFLDEPTESLHRGEVDVLFDAVRRLAAQGAGIVFVSHRLDEVLSLADRIAVLRNGVAVANQPIAEVDEARLVELITGASPEEIVRGARSGGGADPSAEPVLHVRGLHGGSVEHLDLDLRPGEIVGVAGVLGSGREQVPSLLFGATPGEASEFTIAGTPVAKRSPADSLRRGLAFTPGDRAHLGIVREMTARENVTLPQMRTLTGRWGAISSRRERAEVTTLMTDYEVLPHRPDQRIGLYSGGNQQKLGMARALRDRPAVLLLDEPTQGVDIGAKATIYDAVKRGAAQGTAVLVSSSDAKELIGICDRVIVMRDGRIAAELSGSDLTEHRLVAEGYGLP